MTIAKVEPLVTTRALRGPFDYLLPERLGEVGVGSVLRIPFGRQRLLGVVVDVAEESELPPERLAEPIEALEAGASAELVRLGLWVAHEYCSTPARGLELALPPGTATARRPRGAAPRAARRGDRRRGGGARRAARGSGRASGQPWSCSRARMASSAADAIRERAGADRQTLRRLEGRGLVRLREVEVSRRPAEVAVGAPAERVDLNPAQTRAVERIVGALDAGPGTELLLWGVTGSGKTEVYLAAAEAALERGLGAIVLVPEIALTPQVLARFRHRLGDRVALLHSALRPGERRDEWERLRSGAARVCVGPRSAVFAPVAGLGLIVIDEEHEPTYKQESRPALRRPRGRAAARRGDGGRDRGRQCNPASRELARARAARASRASRRPRAAAGRRPRHARAARAGGAAAPADARGAGRRRRRRAARRSSSSTAAAGLPSSAAASADAAGSAASATSRSSSTAPRSASPAITAVTAEPLPRACPDCGSVTLARQGSGTERVEPALAKLVAPAPVFRLDSDSAGRRDHGEVLARFEAAPSRESWSGPRWSPAGTTSPTSSSASSSTPTRRCASPTSAPRSGRSPSSASSPGAAGAASAAGGSRCRRWRRGRRRSPTRRATTRAGFLAGELERRRALAYPPFSHLARVELTSPEAAVAQGAAERLGAGSARCCRGEATLLGPAPRFRLRGRHRRQLLIKAPERAPAVRAIREAVLAAAAAKDLRGASLSVDVDPQ